MKKIGIDTNDYEELIAFIETHYDQIKEVSTSCKAMLFPILIYHLFWYNAIHHVVWEVVQYSVYSFQFDYYYDYKDNANLYICI